MVERATPSLATTARMRRIFTVGDDIVGVPLIWFALDGREDSPLRHNKKYGCITSFFTHLRLLIYGIF